jgi:hypothetical protein
VQWAFIIEAAIVAGLRKEREAIMSTTINDTRAGNPHNRAPQFIFVFHEDPGHGWLAVPRALIQRLGLGDQISHCSYQDTKGMVYLEEDVDQQLFLAAADRANLDYDFHDYAHDDFCFIRELPRYALTLQDVWPMV